MINDRKLILMCCLVYLWKCCFVGVFFDWNYLVDVLVEILISMFFVMIVILSVYKFLLIVNVFLFLLILNDI